MSELGRSKGSITRRRRGSLTLDRSGLAALEVVASRSQSGGAGVADTAAAHVRVTLTHNRPLSCIAAHRNSADFDLHAAPCCKRTVATRQQVHKLAHRRRRVARINPICEAFQKLVINKNITHVSIHTTAHARMHTCFIQPVALVSLSLALSRALSLSLPGCATHCRLPAML